MLVSIEKLDDERAKTLLVCIGSHHNVNIHSHVRLGYEYLLSLTLERVKMLMVSELLEGKDWREKNGSGRKAVAQSGPLPSQGNDLHQ